MHPPAIFHSDRNGHSTFVGRESDTSNGAGDLQHRKHVAALSGHTARHSNDTTDYRGMIDDLSLEIKGLRDELSHYKPTVPRMLRTDKLFEIRVHNLSGGQKRELEATLRTFAAGVEVHPVANPGRRKASFKHAKQDRNSTFAPAMQRCVRDPVLDHQSPAMPPGHFAPTGTSGTSGISLGRLAMEQGLAYQHQHSEHYLHVISPALYSRTVAMTDKEKEDLVVRRLESLFTGNTGDNTGRPHARRPLEYLRPENAASGAFGQYFHEGQSERFDLASTSRAAELTHEIAIQTLSQQSCHLQTRSRSTETAAAAGSKYGPTALRGNCGEGGRQEHIINYSSATNAPQVLEQRSTRPSDLDPDRVQNLSENFDYIRRFGLVPLEPFGDKEQSVTDVHTDAKGWVYLNLLCNMAQLHLLNVTTTFVRAAVAGVSTEFQISPDGSKVRWLGSSGGTKLCGDKPGTYTQGSPDTGGSGEAKVPGSRKSLAAIIPFGDNVVSDTSSKKKPKLGCCLSGVGAVERFHYTPLFVKQVSFDTPTSVDGTLSVDAAENGNISDLRSGRVDFRSYRKKRSHDGTIIYYRGVPFCFDFSADPTDVSPASHTAAVGHGVQEPPSECDYPTERQPDSVWTSSPCPLTDETCRTPAQQRMSMAAANFPA